MSAKGLDELTGIGDAVIDVRLYSALADVCNSDAVARAIVVGKGNGSAISGPRGCTEAG